MLDVSTHKNVENVIRYFLLYLPPRGEESILDVGGGCTDLTKVFYKQDVRNTEILI